MILIKVVKIRRRLFLLKSSNRPSTRLRETFSSPVIVRLRRNFTLVHKRENRVRRQTTIRVNWRKEKKSFRSAVCFLFRSADQFGRTLCRIEKRRKDFVFGQSRNFSCRFERRKQFKRSSWFDKTRRRIWKTFPNFVVRWRTDRNFDRWKINGKFSIRTRRIGENPRSQ